MKFRRQQVQEESINVTSLIDVVFILLLFFMVSTSFTKATHLQVNLPQANGEPQVDPVEEIEIIISEQGAYSINGQGLVDSEVLTLKSAMSKISNGNTNLPLLITADAKTPHQSVVSVMDVAGQLGFTHLSITTRQPDLKAADR